MSSRFPYTDWGFRDMGNQVTILTSGILPPPLWGRVRVGDVLSKQGVFDARQDTVDIVEDVVVPESQDAKALAFQPSGAGLVPTLLVRVLSAIQFDDKAFGETDEVDDIVSDRCLPPELTVLNLPASKAPPGPFLSFGEVLSEVSGTAGIHATSLPRPMAGAAPPS